MILIRAWPKKRLDLTELKKLSRLIHAALPKPPATYVHTGHVTVQEAAPPAPAGALAPANDLGLVGTRPDLCWTAPARSRTQPGIIWAPALNWPDESWTVKSMTDHIVNGLRVIKHLLDDESVAAFHAAWPRDDLWEMAT